METATANNTMNQELILELAKAGVLYSHKKSKTHPKMKPFISGSRNEIELLDPQAIFASLEKAIEFLKEKARGGAVVLLVGTLPAAQGAIRSLAKAFGFPYITNRWLGGTLTNFKVINGRVQYYLDLKKKQETGELEKYTKKEQHLFNEELKKLTDRFEGLVPLTRLPDVLFIVDIKEHDTALREARRLGIPIVAIVDSDDDPTLVTFPVVANDHAKSSIEWVMEKLHDGIKQSANQESGIREQTSP